MIAARLSVCLTSCLVCVSYWRKEEEEEDEEEEEEEEEEVADKGWVLKSIASIYYGKDPSHKKGTKEEREEKNVVCWRVCTLWDLFSTKGNRYDVAEHGTLAKLVEDDVNGIVQQYLKAPHEEALPSAFCETAEKLLQQKQGSGVNGDDDDDETVDPTA